MIDFLDEARKILRENKLSYMWPFAAFFDALPTLQRTYAESNLDLANVETILSALEIGQLLSFKAHKVESCYSLADSLRYIMVHTLEERLRFTPTGMGLRSPHPYDEFVELLAELRAHYGLHASCVITFNYDVGVDFALQSRFDIDYALPKTSGRGDSFTLLKLHGSMNWFNCVNCHDIVVMDLTDAPNETYMRISNRFTLWPHVTKLKHNVSADNVIVPPVWNKGPHHNQLSRVWSRAARELNDAENIFVIGYSFPPTDEFFRHLYLLATNGGNFVRRFWVFNPETSGTVESRFAGLTGWNATKRFHYFAEGFSEAIQHIRELLYSGEIAG